MHVRPFFSSPILKSALNKCRQKEVKVEEVGSRVNKILSIALFLVPRGSAEEP